MDYRTLSKEELVNVLEQLISEGQVSEMGVNSVVDAHSLTKFADALHTAMCLGPHIKGCPYYEEEEMPQPWGLPAHRVWLRMAEFLCEDIGFGSAQEIFWQVYHALTPVVEPLSKIAHAEIVLETMEKQRWLSGMIRLAKKGASNAKQLAQGDGSRVEDNQTGGESAL